MRLLDSYVSLANHEGTQIKREIGCLNKAFSVFVVKLYGFYQEFITVINSYF